VLPEKYHLILKNKWEETEYEYKAALLGKLEVSRCSCPCPSRPAPAAPAAAAAAAVTPRC